MNNVITLEVDARRSAEEEVARLLLVPADLKRLQTFRDDQAAKQQMVRAQLSGTIAAQVDSTRSGLELLDKGQIAVLKMRDAFSRINGLCDECNALVLHHGKIQQLAAIHYNITKTLQYAEHIAELPQQAQDAEKMLSDDTSLLQAFEVLSVLECTTIKAKKALEAGAKISVAETKNLATYFTQVQYSFNRFEERLWSIIRNFMRYSQESPWLLTNAVRVVETQELVDKQLKNATEVGLEPVVKPKYYRKRAEQQVANYLDEKFASLQQRCSQLYGADDNTKERVKVILADADSYISELEIIYDDVAPCFPAHYKIFEVVCGEYQKQVSSMLDVIGMCSDNQANSDILEVIGWVERYLGKLESLGVDEKDAALPSGKTAGLTLLIAKYTERTKSILAKWYTNILNDDFTRDPKENSEGHAFTEGVTDFFRILNEQLALLASVSRGDFLLKIAQVLLDTIHDYQALQAEKVKALTDVSNETEMCMLCAMVNNNVRSYSLSLDFKDDLRNMLDKQFKDALNIDPQSQGFLDLCLMAVRQLVDGMFAIPAFAELFRKLYYSEEWFDRSVTASVTATLGEYFFSSTSYWCPASNFATIATTTLERTVQYFTAAALTNIKAVTDAIISGVQADLEAIDSFFTTYIKADVVALEIQQLVDVRALLASDSIDAFLLSYTSLLQSCPGITPAMVEKLVQARPDMSRASVREIVEQCREVYMDRQRSLSVEEAAKLKPSGKEVGFDRALVAAQRIGGRLAEIK